MMAASSSACNNVQECAVLSDGGGANNFATAANEAIAKEEIPTIDFSRLMSDNPEERSEMVQEIGKACKDWGCFRLLNHGVPESLKTKMLEVAAGFFDLKAEEKRKYMHSEIFDPIRYASSANSSVKGLQYWREFMRVMVHPKFHFPAQQVHFSEIYEEYARCTREISAELLRALWESLGLSESIIEERLQLKLGTQILVNNFYPPSPQQDPALGFPPHTDLSLLSIGLQKEAIACLQVMRHGEWVPFVSFSNSFFVNVGDLLEIVSNGIFKSVLHRVMNNNESSRISVVSIIGTPLEIVIAPLPQLVDSAKRPAAFRTITLKEYIEQKQTNNFERSFLDQIRQLQAVE